MVGMFPLVGVCHLLVSFMRNLKGALRVGVSKLEYGYQR